MILTEAQKILIKAHCIEEYESRYEGKDKAIEGCGFILNDGSVMPCKNTSDAPDTNFVIAEADCTAAYRLGVTAVFHSHVSGDGNFSWSDGKGCRQTNKPWVLYDVVSNSFKTISPIGNGEYINRQFCWWVSDCYSLVQDYYQYEFGITLDDFDRPELSNTPQIRWQPEGWNVFQESFASQGFERVDARDIRRGDVLMFSLHGGNINHIGVMHDLESNHFLHQLANQPSKLEVWGEAWGRHCISVVRHKEVK